MTNGWMKREYFLQQDICKAKPKISSKQIRQNHQSCTQILVILLSKNKYKRIIWNNITINNLLFQMINATLIINKSYFIQNVKIINNKSSTY